MMVLNGQLCHTPLTKQLPASDYSYLSIFLLGMYAKEIAQLEKKANDSEVDYNSDSY